MNGIVLLSLWINVKCREDDDNKLNFSKLSHDEKVGINMQLNSFFLFLRVQSLPTTHFIQHFKA